MKNQDYCFIISQLEKRLNRIEGVVAEIRKSPDVSDQVWDKATLMKEWKISPRTVANYQRQGLQYYKRGGRVYFTPEQRNEFIIKNNRWYEKN